MSHEKEIIRKLMHDSGMTVYALAQKTDLSQASISNWYNKKNSTPSVTALKRVCKVFGITMSQLFCENEEFYPVSGALKELCYDWQNLNDKQRDTVISVIKSYLD